MPVFSILVLSLCALPLVYCGRSSQASPFVLEDETPDHEHFSRLSASGRQFLYPVVDLRHAG
jgi:hypothetical protein